MSINIQSDHNKMIKEWLRNSDVKKAYNNLEEEFALFDAMFKARQQSGLTQEEVAKQMGTKKSVISRLESSGGKEKHSPSIRTLQRYAEAIGCRLIIKFKHCDC